MKFSAEDGQSPATPKHQQRAGLPTFGSANPPRIRTERSNYEVRAQNPRYAANYAYDDHSLRSPAEYSEENDHQGPPVLARRGSNMITGLRTELMNIKTEVTKMMAPRPNEPTPRQFRCDRSETSSASQVSESIERCNRNLKTKVSVRDKFVEMELESLQAELNCFKRKYSSRKEQHKEEVARLNRKIQLLQELLQQNEAKMEDYKADINQELRQIQQQLAQSTTSNERALTEQEVETLRLEIIQLEEKLIQAAEADKANSQRYETEVFKLREQLRLTAEEHTSEVEKLKLERAQLESLTKENEAQQISSAKANEMLAEYEVKLESVKQDHSATLKCKQEEFEQQLSLLKSNKEAVEMKLEEAASKLEDIEAMLTEKNALLVEKDLMITQLQQQTAAALESNKRQLEVEEQANYELCEKLIEKDAEIASLKEVASEKTTELEKIQGSLSEIASKCELIYSTSEELAAQKDKLNAELQAIREELEVKVGECSALQTILQEKELQLSEVSREDMAVVEEFKVRIMALAEDQYRLAQQMETKCQESDMQESEIRHLAGLYNESLELLKRKESELEEVHYNYEGRLKEAELTIQGCNSQLQQQDFEHRNMVEALRSEINNLKYASSNSRQEVRVFDDALKEQMEENKRLRLQLGEKNEDLHRIRQQSALTRSQLDNLKSQLEIDKLRWIAERKNIQVGLEVECQNLRNQLETERRTGESLNSKLRFIVEQVKKKDEFIQKHIVQRRLQPKQTEELDAFFKQYRLEFPVDRIKDKLNSELHEIGQLERTNRNLLSEICQLREQLQQKQLKHEQTTTLTDSPESGAYPVEEVVDLDEQPCVEYADEVQEELKEEEPVYSSAEKIEEQVKTSIVEKSVPQTFSLEAMAMKLTDETASLIGIDTSMDRFSTELDSVDYE